MARPTLTTKINDLKADVHNIVASRTGGSIALPLLPHQRHWFGGPGAWKGPRHVCLAKGRRAGGTFGGALRALELMLAIPGLRVLWVDTTHRNLSKLVKRVLTQHLTRVAKGRFTLNMHDLVLALDNGSLMDLASAENPTAAEGWAYDLLIINEAGLVLRDEALYLNTILPMTIENGVAGEGAIEWFIGTPKGRGLFHALFLRGLDDLESDWISHQASSDINPTVNAKALAKHRQRMPAELQRQEFDGEFLQDGSLFFASIESAATLQPETGPKPGIHYVIGVDLAKSEDFTVCWVGRADKRHAVHCERWNKMLWPETVRKIAALSKRWNAAHCVVDMTGLGSVVVDDLRDAGVAVEGVILNNATKVELLTLLGADMEQARFHLYPHEQTLVELRAFERKILPSGNYRLEAGPGMHDDTVIALALLNQGMGRPTDATGTVLEIPSRFASEQMGMRLLDLELSDFPMGGDLYR